MQEDQIAAKIAQNIPTEVHIPSPVVEQEPQPSAFESNIELNDPAIGMQLVDYFDIGRIDRFNEETQRQLRTVYQWAAEKAQSTDKAAVLTIIRQLEMELGATFTTDRLARLSKFVRLNKQSEALRLQMDALYG